MYIERDNITHIMCICTCMYYLRIYVCMYAYKYVCMGMVGTLSSLHLNWIQLATAFVARLVAVLRVVILQGV